MVSYPVNWPIKRRNKLEVKDSSFLLCIIQNIALVYFLLHTGTYVENKAHINLLKNEWNQVITGMLPFTITMVYCHLQMHFVDNYRRLKDQT